MKTFATEKGAKAAVRKQALHLMPHRFEKTTDGRAAGSKQRRRTERWK
jgi:hypothetical protein